MVYFSLKEIFSTFDESVTMTENGVIRKMLWVLSSMIVLYMWDNTLAEDYREIGYTIRTSMISTI